MFGTVLIAYEFWAFVFTKLSESTHVVAHAGACPPPAPYGKQVSVTIPVFCKYCQACGSRPPPQPLSPESQLTKSSADSTGDALPVAIATRSLSTSEAENAQ